MKVLIKKREQKMRMGPSKEYPENGYVYAGSVFTIIDQKNGYGLLKSHAGWIEMKYVEVLEG